MRSLGQLEAFYFSYEEVLQTKKNTSKKHTSRYVLKIFKKELFIYL